MEEVEDGYFKITALHSGKALTVWRGMNKNDAKVVQESYMDREYQKWDFVRSDLVDTPPQDSSDSSMTDGIVVTVYPNPSHGAFSVSILNGWNEEALALEVYNFRGELVLRRTLKESRFDSPADLKPGMYFIKLIGRNRTVSRRLVIH